ncbi:MAG: hypothetical protein FJ026_05210, partial [Chloroflexi bacterium]|nr:hypothetical protein [Chloroflexota bacterium]
MVLRLRSQRLAVSSIVLPLALAAVYTAPQKMQSASMWPSHREHGKRLAEPLSPLMFIENTGQFTPVVRFQVLGVDRILWLGDNALWLTVLQCAVDGTNTSGVLGELEPAAGHASRDVHLKLTFVNANPHPRLEAFDRLPVHISYLIGKDPAKWQADVPVWRGVRYKDLYPGLDLELSSQGGHLVQRMVAHPGADPTVVRLRVEGADRVILHEDHLRVATATAQWKVPLFTLVTDSTALPEPVPNAVARGHEVTAPFVPRDTSGPGPSSVSPALAETSLLYATYLGGADYDEGHHVAVDGSGNAFVTGYTRSLDFPTTPGAIDYTVSRSDAFVVKLDASASALIYATFLGASQDDMAYGAALDDSGNLFVTGKTWSPDFPVTPGAFDTSFNGELDAFVAKLNSTGTALVYATFLGGWSDDWAKRIVVDGQGAAYVTGPTNSVNFPTTAGAMDQSLGGQQDAFVAKLNAAGSALVYATFLGGSADDWSDDLAIDGAGNAYIGGATGSGDFPTTAGAFQRTLNGGLDAFVAKLNSTGSALLFATYLGGNSNEWCSGVALDETGSVYVTGGTRSPNFPTSADAYARVYAGEADIFLAKLNSSGSSLLYATLLGGSEWEEGVAISVDGYGRACFTGGTRSRNFPTTVGAFSRTLSGTRDAFVAV